MIQFPEQNREEEQNRTKDRTKAAVFESNFLTIFSVDKKSTEYNPRLMNSFAFVEVIFCNK